MEQIQYKHEVFLSFTGADREHKSAIREYLENYFRENSELEEPCYDSDLYCNGRFREDYIRALDQSRVYLLILSDNLNNDPAKSGYGWLTEVRKEVSLALELEARGQLNIVILCMSEFFKFKNGFHDYHDTMGWFFYSNTRGYSQIGATLAPDGSLSGVTLESVLQACKRFVTARKKGDPMPSQSPKIDVADIRFVNEMAIMGRDDDIKRAIEAYENGRQLVVLTGMGGIGKTSLAKEIARRCDELDYLRCPQIVHIQELGGKNSGLHALVSSVKYEDDLYKSIESLSESDRVDKKIASLASLPETILLVIDNYNSIAERDIRDILSRLKCRLLITTRARVRSNSEIEVIPVERLREGAAFDMFCDIAQRRVDTEGFSRLYSLVGGHTITLCIMAKMLLVHQMSFDEIIEEMGELEAFDARVDFEHNEYGDPDTVLGHLKRLFNINDFDEGCKRVLRSLSLLSSGTIKTSTLREVLGLKNRNEIEELSSKGWIEIQHKQIGEEQIEYIYIHPVISRLMAQLLDPNEENVVEMIDYITDEAKRSRMSLTFSDAVVLEEMLFYACYIIASGSGALVKCLWEEFVLINHQLRDAQSTRKKTIELASRLHEQSERDSVLAYGDMSVIEQYPTRTEYLKKYLDTLDKNARDYKFVLRSLSIMLPYIINDSRHTALVNEAISKALDSAIYRKDDIAIFGLYSDTLALSLDKSIMKRIVDYVRVRKKDEDAELGALLYIELTQKSLKFFNPKDLTTELSRLYADIAESPILSGIKRVLRHPITFMGLIRTQRALTKNADTDPFARAYSKIEAFAEAMIEEGKLKVNEYIEAMIEMHRVTMEAGNTLASARQVVTSAIGSLSLFPEWMVREEAQRVVEEVDVQRLSIGDISRLQVAVEINAMFNDKLAISQSREILKALESIRPEGHVDLYDAMIRHAGVCSTLGCGEEALTFYLKTYNLMASRAEDSSKLRDVALRMLGLSSGAERLTLKDLETLLNRVFNDVESTLEDKFSSLVRYAQRVADKLRTFKGDKEPYLDKISKLLDDATGKIRVYPLSVQNILLNGIATLCCKYTKLFPKAHPRYAELVGFLKRFAKSRNAGVRKRARASVSSAEFYNSYYHVSPDSFELARASLKTSLKTKRGLNEATNNLWIVMHERSVKTLKDFVLKMVKSPSVQRKILTRARICERWHFAPGEEEDWTDESFYQYFRKCAKFNPNLVFKRGKRVRSKSVDKYIKKVCSYAIAVMDNSLSSTEMYWIKKKTVRETNKSIRREVAQELKKSQLK